MSEAVTATEIPDTVESLRELVKQLQNQLLWAEEKYKALVMRYFGRKSEKGKEGDSKQYRLFDEAEAYAEEEGKKETGTIIIASHERKKRGRRNKAGRAPVPEREELHELGSEERRCPCCGKERPEIGEERSSEYDLIPEHVVKIVHIRKKYGRCGCEGSEGQEPVVLTAPGPEKIVPGSDYTNRSTAFFITGKYADGIPFYRMEVSRACLSHQALLVGRAVSPLIEG
jgi:transposase